MLFEISGVVFFSFDLFTQSGGVFGAVGNLTVNNSKYWSHGAFVVRAKQTQAS